MEDGGEKVSSQQPQGASYTYWVREATPDAVPLPVPKMLSQNDIVSQNSDPATLGSVWNRAINGVMPDLDARCAVELILAGTWEEKSLNKWASDRIKELLITVGTLEFTGGKAEIKEVSNCIGDAFLVTVRNKKRVGYTYELTLKVKGEWIIQEEKKMVKGRIEIPEFSFGELDDLQMEVKLSDEKDLLHQDKKQICQDLKKFLQPVREKLLQFEQELKDR